MDKSAKLQTQLETILYGRPWPEAGMADEQKWLQSISPFKPASVELTQLISGFPEEKWTQITHDTRGNYPDDGAAYKGLITGLVQHHVYHTGQILLLNKMING